MKACPGHGLLMFSFALSIYYFSCVHCFDLSVFLFQALDTLLLRLTGPHSEITWPYPYACNVQVQVHLFTLIQSGSARVFGYRVYRGFLNQVYGILRLKYGYSVYHFL